MTKKSYTVRELASSVGVSTATLRAWERRYGFMAPERTSGGHRLYTETDLKLFIYINHLRTTGQSLVRLSSLGREALLEQAASYFKDLGTVQAESAYESQLAAEIVNLLESRDTKTAFERLDRAAVTATSPTEFANLTLRIMTDIGLSWEQGRISVSVEHLFTSQIRFLLAEQFYRKGNAMHGAGKLAVTHRNNKLITQDQVPVVVAGVEGEVHEIGLLRVAIFLQDWGASVSFLGANLPLADLEGFTAEQAKSSPDGDQLIVCLSVSGYQDANTIKSLARDLDAGIANRHITILGGSGSKFLSPSFFAPKNLVVTENLDVLKSILEIAKDGKVKGLTLEQRRKALANMTQHEQIKEQKLNF